MQQTKYSVCLHDNMGEKEEEKERQINIQFNYSGWEKFPKLKNKKQPSYRWCRIHFNFEHSWKKCTIHEQVKNELFKKKKTMKERKKENLKFHKPFKHFLTSITGEAFIIMSMFLLMISETRSREQGSRTHRTGSGIP